MGRERCGPALGGVQRFAYKATSDVKEKTGMKPRLGKRNFQFQFLGFSRSDHLTIPHLGTELLSHRAQPEHRKNHGGCTWSRAVTNWLQLGAERPARP